MKKTIRNVFSALLLVALAAWIIVCAFTGWSVFFPGWWTLFMIIPALYGFINDGFNFFNTILFLIGGALLAHSYLKDAFDLRMVFYIVLAVLLVALALRIILKPVFVERKRKAAEHAIPGSSDNDAGYSVKFSSKNVNFDGKEFNGATLDVSFGSITLDLSHAIISHDADVFVNVDFGSVEILLPDNVGVEDKIKSNFGGVDIKSRPRNVDGAYPKIIVSGECSFGGVEIK